MMAFTDGIHTEGLRRDIGSQSDVVSMVKARIRDK